MCKISSNILLSGNIVDAVAHVESSRIDPQIDRGFFMNHPEKVFYKRDASHLEKQAYGLVGSKTAITEVKLESDGKVFWTRRLTWDPAKGKRPTTTF